jgi:carbon storage regulator
MLVLSRKPGEKILISDEIMIMIVRIGPNTVRIGIEAPSHVTIVRDELSVPKITGTAPTDDVVWDGDA